MTLDEVDDAYQSGIAKAIASRKDGVTWSDEIRRAGLRSVVEALKPSVAKAVKSANSTPSYSYTAKNCDEAATRWASQIMGGKENG